MAEKEVRKTTAKKTVRRSTTKVAPRKTVVRKTAEATAKAAPVRKAPSRSVITSPTRTRGSRKFIVLVIIFILVMGASVGIGFTDKGQIDVTSVISTRKQSATGDEQRALESVPVQQGQTGVVNGGLVGTGAPSPLVPTNPAPVSASSTASSTESTATSTEAAPSLEESENVDAPQEEPEEGAAPAGTEGEDAPIPQ